MKLADAATWWREHSFVAWLSLVAVAELVLLIFGLSVLLVVNVLAAAVWYARSKRRR